MEKIEYNNGDIVIYNCDCFELIKEMKSKNIMVDAVLTDPPYNLLIDKSSSSSGTAKNKSHKIETGIDWELFCKESYDILNDNKFFTFFQCWRSAAKGGWFEKTTKAGFEPKMEIIWDKLQLSDFLSNTPNKHENMYLYTKGDRGTNKVLYDKYELEFENQEHKGKFYDRLKRDFDFIKQVFDTKENLLEYMDLHFDNKVEYGRTSMVNDEIHMSAKVKGMKAWLSSVKKIIKGGIMSSVIEMKSHNNQFKNKPEYNIKHPTVKPIQLLEMMVKKTSNEGELIFDPFLGSGTTAIACLNTNRKFIGCEIDKEYFEIIKERLDKLTADKNNGTQDEQQ